MARAKRPVRFRRQASVPVNQPGPGQPDQPQAASTKAARDPSPVTGPRPVSIAVGNYRTTTGSIGHVLYALCDDGRIYKRRITGWYTIPSIPPDAEPEPTYNRDGDRKHHDGGEDPF